MLLGVAIGNGIGIVTMPLSGAVSDAIGRRPMLIASYGLSALYVLFAFFPMLSTASPALVIVAMAIPGAILQPLSLAVTGSFYPELFGDARVRLSGVSLGRQMGTILGGGLMPMVASSLLALSHGSLTWVIEYFVAICVAAIVAVRTARETSGAGFDDAEVTEGTV
jgi:MFS family permease